MLFALLLWTLARAAVYDRVVAQVDQQLVLASDVALDSALQPYDRSGLPFWSAAHDPLDRQIAGAAIRVAAGDISVYQPSNDEVVARLEALHAAFPTSSAWDNFLRLHGLDEASLRAVVRRRLIVERYLRRNVLADPEDGPAWLAAADRVIDALLPRIRVRRIAAEEP